MTCAAVDPPVAKKEPKELTLHGETRIDNYFWMRDRSRPDVVRYLEAENAYTAAIMKPAEPLQAKIYAEILSHIKQTDLSVPVKRDDYFYYSRTEEGKQYPIYCRKKGGLTAPEQVLLDANELARGKNYFALGAFAVSENHKLLAYSVDFDGSENFTIHVKEAATGRLLPDEIPNTTYGVAWANDNTTFFYVTMDATRRPEKVHRHVLGSSTDDPVLFTESDPQFSFELGKSRSKRYIMIESVNASKTSEVLYLDADRPNGNFQVIEPRQPGVEYYAEHQDGHFLIRTNDGGAINFKLMTAPVSSPSKKNWKLLLPAREDATLDGVDAFEKYQVLYMREKGLPTVHVRDSEGQDYSIDFPEPAYAVFPHDNVEYKTGLLRFTYTSLVTPNSVFDYDMKTKARELKKQTEVPGYDPAKYVSERIHAPAHDGRQVPVSLVYRKGLSKNGENPALLRGYGSYGSNSDPVFSAESISLLDRGFVVATAHIRGGAEYGRSWFEDGRLLNKKNTFTDFIAAAEYLVAQRYTSPAKLAAMGGSAGGLLMGAIINMRPDLFHTVIARVPFVDVINTMLDPSIPLTTNEYDQWGNPNDKRFYEYMKSYSPYDNVEAKAYPNLLVTTGLNDPRVAYWEPAKWTAKLRAMKTDHNLLLLKTHMGAGHAGPSGRYEHFHETAFFWSFILYTMGMNE